MLISTENCRFIQVRKGFDFWNSQRIVTATAVNDPDVVVQGRSQLSLSLDVTPDQTASMLRDGLTVQEISFDQQDESGEIASTIKGASIYYPGFGEGERRVTMNESDYLYFDRVDQLRLDRISWNPQEGGLNLVLDGYATPLTGRSRHHLIDQRLCLFDVLWVGVKTNKFWTAIAVLLGVCWTVFERCKSLREYLSNSSHDVT
jgi:hypothetical protein